MLKDYKVYGHTLGISVPMSCSVANSCLRGVVVMWFAHFDGVSHTLVLMYHLCLVGYPQMTVTTCMAYKVCLPYTQLTCHV